MYMDIRRSSTRAYVSLIVSLSHEWRTEVWMGNTAEQICIYDNLFNVWLFTLHVSFYQTSEMN